MQLLANHQLDSSLSNSPPDPWDELFSKSSSIRFSIFMFFVHICILLEVLEDNTFLCFGNNLTLLLIETCMVVFPLAFVAMKRCNQAVVVCFYFCFYVFIVIARKRLFSNSIFNNFQLVSIFDCTFLTIICR